MEKRMYSGVPGMLRPFKEYLESLGMKPADQIVYYGVPGTCTPFIELFAFSVRSLELEQVFVPYFDETKARLILPVTDVGMQVSTGMPGALSPKVLVILGGLSMPNVPVTVEDAKRTVDLHPGSSRVGICFMHIFDKAGWMELLRFAFLIDATISPVEVTG
jgi:hypothetical protein